VLAALLSSALVTAFAALSPTPAYTVDGEWLTRATPRGDVVWARHVTGFEMREVAVDPIEPAVLVVRGDASQGTVSFGDGSLVLGEGGAFVVRFSAIDGAYLSAAKASP